MEDLSNMNEDLEKLKAETYAKEKASAETKEISTIVQDTNKTLDTKLNMALSDFVNTDEQVQEQIKKTAGKLVETGLKKQEHKVNKEKKDAEKEENISEFNLDEDTYRAFGQESAPSENWKKKFIKGMANFWFVVISIICFFTLAPFYMYVKVIKSQSKLLKFVAAAIGILLLLACLAGLTYALLKWCGVF